MIMIAMQKESTRAKRTLPPLINGDHLDQKTFHERYEAMPEDVRAELIGGIVYMSSPQKPRHGRYHLKLSQWLGEYEDATPGVEGYVNTTQILAEDAEPQPDACLLVLPDYGGQTWVEDGYLAGAPEWLGEISDATESIDLNSKKLDYEKAGVREYMVAATRSGEVFWFVRRRGKFKELSPGSDGIFRSEVFPGLWLDRDAFLKRNSKRLLAVLRQGLASPEHAAFVAKLAAKKS
jgi:Putative restriction endonuclease